MHTKPPVSLFPNPRSRFRGRGFFLAFLALASTLGCKQFSKIGKPDSKYDLLEAELRTRERELLEARSELNQLRPYAEGYARGPVIQPHEATPLAHGSRSTGTGFAIKEVLLGNGTGGRDDDGIPGDEMLQVVVVPKDDDGTAIKIPARIAVAAFEISREGFKVPIGQWEITPEQLRKTWKSGLFGSGYFVPLSWDRPPTTDRIRIVVRLTTLDGRDFEADKDAKVVPLTRTPPGVRPLVPGTGSLELPPPRISGPTSGPATPGSAVPTVLPPPLYPEWPMPSMKPAQDPPARLLPARPID
jgi:hypothetical protein